MHICLHYVFTEYSIRFFLYNLDNERILKRHNENGPSSLGIFAPNTKGDAMKIWKSSFKICYVSSRKGRIKTAREGKCARPENFFEPFDVSQGTAPIRRNFMPRVNSTIVLCSVMRSGIVLIGFTPLRKGVFCVWRCIMYIICALGKFSPFSSSISFSLCQCSVMGWM